MGLITIAASFRESRTGASRQVMSKKLKFQEIKYIHIYVPTHILILQCYNKMGAAGMCSN